MAARGQPYTPARIYIDGLRQLAIGDFIATPAGSCYLVQGIRPSPSKPCRRYLETVRWPIAELPAGATVYELHWYRRKSKRPRA